MGRNLPGNLSFLNGFKTNVSK
ncbi:MAG: hypothetical protein METHSR3v1_1530016 [Methanothrix sp.]|nr:MAG: hypothetical protein METHSR3v1_1530016 [Methanothrix sp.]